MERRLKKAPKTLLQVRPNYDTRKDWSAQWREQNQSIMSNSLTPVNIWTRDAATAQLLAGPETCRKTWMYGGMRIGRDSKMYGAWL